MDNNNGDKGVDETNNLIAATAGGSKKKSPEELKVIKLRNLKKARAAKTLYRKLDEEAKKKGEVPPSIARKAERDFPIMLDGDKNVRLLDLKAQL